jgi:hypothetical protein
MTTRCGAGCGRFVKAGRVHCDRCLPSHAEMPDATKLRPVRRTKWFRLFGRKESL